MQSHELPGYAERCPLNGISSSASKSASGDCVVVVVVVVGFCWTAACAPPLGAAADELFAAGTLLVDLAVVEEDGLAGTETLDELWVETGRV